MHSHPHHAVVNEAVMPGGRNDSPLGTHEERSARGTSTIATHSRICVINAPASLHAGLMKVAISYEPVCVGGVHAPFIAGMIEALLATHDRVFFIGDPSQIDAVAKLITPQVSGRIYWDACAVAPLSEYRFWPRLPEECRILNRVVRLARENNACTILATGFTRPGLTVAKLASRFVLPHTNFGVIAHMLLSTLSESRRDRCLVKFGNPKRFKILVLGQSTLIAARRAFRGADGLFSCVTHPYPMADAPSCGAVLEGGPLVFGFPGLAAEGKGFPTFLNIAEKLHGPNARFVVVGRVLDDSPSRERAERLVAAGALSVLSMGSEQVPSATFRRELQLVHYLVYPYSADAYALVRSGAAIDALWAARPLIASHIPMFEDLFSRIGDVGYLCDSESEFISTIQRLIAAPPTVEYERQSSNLVAGRHLFSARAVGAEITEAFVSRV